MLVAILKQGAFGQDSIEKTADELIPSHLLEHVQGGNFEGITAALEASNEDINLQNSNGWSAARFAVSNGDFDMTRFLIEKQIDLNNPDNEGVTPLMVAAAQVFIIIIFVKKSFLINCCNILQSVTKSLLNCCSSRMLVLLWWRRMEPLHTVLPLLLVRLVRLFQKCC